MQVTVFDPNTSTDGIVILPARLAIPTKDGATRYKYTRSYRLNGFYAQPISCVFDKPSNRVRLYMDLLPRGNSKFDKLRGYTDAVVRSCFEVKLDIPRGSLSTQKMSRYKVIEMPGYWSGAEGKLRAQDGTEQSAGSTDKLRRTCYQSVYDWLFRMYNANGCPAEVDRRKLPELLKAYTGELREKWRIDQHSFEYPAHSLASIIADKLSHRRDGTLTFEQLMEWHLIPDYPELTLLSSRSRSWDSMRQTKFLGIYTTLNMNQVKTLATVGATGCNTKNAQLALKLSEVLGTQVTLQDLTNAFTAFIKDKPSSSQELPWLSFTGLITTSVYIVAVTKTTQRQEAR